MQQLIQEIKEEFDGKFSVMLERADRENMSSTEWLESIESFLESSLSKAYLQGKREGATEERQFILNILDGIDIADQQMGNEGGGTRAIRFALKNRIIS